MLTSISSLSLHFDTFIPSNSFSKLFWMWTLFTKYRYFPLVYTFYFIFFIFSFIFANCYWLIILIFYSFDIDVNTFTESCVSFKPVQKCCMCINTIRFLFPLVYQVQVPLPLAAWGVSGFCHDSVFLAVNSLNLLPFVVVNPLTLSLFPPFFISPPDCCLRQKFATVLHNSCAGEPATWSSLYLTEFMWDRFAPAYCLACVFWMD